MNTHTPTHYSSSFGNKSVRCLEISLKICSHSPQPQMWKLTCTDTHGLQRRARRSVWHNKEKSAVMLWRLCSHFWGVPPAREEERKKHTQYSAVDSAVIGISIAYVSQPWSRAERLPAWETSSITALHLSARISLPMPAYCCKCVSHLAAVCRHKAHLSPGLLLDSPPKSAVHY